MDIVKKLLQTEYISSAMEEKADLSAFKEPPTLKIISGLFLIMASFVISWPLISLLGVISVYYKAPLLIAIGGPFFYGLSHLVFMLGMYLCGAKYSRIFFKWVTRVTMERLSGRT